MTTFVILLVARTRIISNIPIVFAAFPSFRRIIEMQNFPLHSTTFVLKPELKAAIVNERVKEWIKVD